MGSKKSFSLTHIHIYSVMLCRFWRNHELWAGKHRGSKTGWPLDAHRRGSTSFDRRFLILYFGLLRVING